MFCLLDDKGIIHIPMSKPGRIGRSADGLGFKLLHKHIGYNGTDVGTHGCNMDLFIILTLEEQIGIFRQNSSDVVMCVVWTWRSCYGVVGPVVIYV